METIPTIWSLLYIPTYLHDYKMGHAWEKESSMVLTFLASSKFGAGTKFSADCSLVCEKMFGLQSNSRRITQHLGRPSVRSLWGMLNYVFNKVDYSRIKELGPDQAAAEWLVRCGAVVKFKNMNKWSTDYNRLPRGTAGQYFIEKVDATDSSIMHVGFDYFIGLNHLSSLKLHHCTYLKNTCLGRLDILKDSLEELQLSSCGDVTDAGVVSLHKLINLNFLFLCDLPGIKDMDSILKTLGTALPRCEIRYLSLEGNKDLKKLGIDKESFR